MKLAVQKWFLQKQYSSSEVNAIFSSDYPTIEKESEKAYLLKFDTDFGIVKGWFPKSVCFEEQMECKSVEQSEIQVGDKVETKDGKILTVKEINGQMLVLSNKKTYLTAMVKKI